MRIHNLLGPFCESLRRWERAPHLDEFVQGYYRFVQPWVEGGFFTDSAAEFYSATRDLDWEAYRRDTMNLDPAREEARLRKCLADVEALFGFVLEGDIVLFSALTMMDGYARFDGGSHRVFLGVDESYAQGRYLDVLMTHELTHVARESRPAVWEGWGLDPRMSASEFGENQPVIEHVFGEGFSCLVSELLVPGERAWTYAYQTEASLKRALEHGPAIDRRIKQEISTPHARSDYTRLYRSSEYGKAGAPSFAQYVWGWQWTKKLLRERFGGNARAMVSTCSKELVDAALSFELRGLG